MSGQSEEPYRNTLVQREKDKIVKVEKKTGRPAQLERISYCTHRTEFKEYTPTGLAKASLRQELTRQREAKLGHVAFILVRREALRRVLEEERQLYSKELSLKGLAIYQQRI